MQELTVISLTHEVNGWLGKSRHARILHVFEHACNLINERGEVISIVSPDIGNGPFNLVVENRGSFSEALTAESPVFLHDDQVRIEDLHIRTTGAKFWHPRPDWECLHEDRGKIAGRLAALPIPDSQIPRGLEFPLCPALARGDVSAATAAASHLAGLGAGLTPAGDDFLMGALYAAWILHPPARAELLARKAAGAAAPLTSSLSAAWLRSAGRCEAGVLWHQYLEALTFSDQAQIRAIMKKIMSVGATSGADALAGFHGTFHAYREIKRSHVLPSLI